MAKKQDLKLTTLNLRLTVEEKSALVKRAKRERLTVSALVRRFAMGLAAALMLACGSDFEAAPTDPVAMAGSGTMSRAGMGSGGMAGSATAGAGGSYDGPAWIDCSDGESITARGLSGNIATFAFQFSVASRGSDYELFSTTIWVNGDPAMGTGFTYDYAKGDNATVVATMHPGSSRPPIPSPVDLRPSDIVTLDLYWQPTTTGEFVPEYADILGCEVAQDDGVIAAWEP